MRYEMENTKALIEDLLSGLQFERRPPVSRQIKEQYAVMEAGTAEALRELSRLHLRLWHAVSQRDYHSLPVGDACEVLIEIRRQLDGLSAALESKK